MDKQQDPQAAPRQTLFSRVAWILLMLLFLAAIILDAFFSESGIIKIWELEREHLQLSSEVKKLERDNAELEALIEALRSDPEEIERVAREELGFARPGEEVFLFPPDEEERISENKAVEASAGQ
ncbi:MAG TPA: septum formation initiator family protein [Acidobacteriota bacterium]|nr:septum formation initiator family protein [Acidobacteriota bacterium]